MSVNLISVSNKENYFQIIAWEGSNQVGTLIAKKKKGSIINVKRISVEPDDREARIGILLMKEIYKVASDQKCQIMIKDGSSSADLRKPSPGNEDLDIDYEAVNCSCYKKFTNVMEIVVKIAFIFFLFHIPNFGARIGSAGI